MIATGPKDLVKPPKVRGWTFDELADEVPESNQPMELWDGELIMPPAPSFSHQKTSDHFHDLLKAWVRKHHLGDTVVSPIDMVLTKHRTTQPDVVFISKERLGIIKKQIIGPADLIAEIISPESRKRDRIDKRDLYEQHGIKEYWIVDPEAETVEVLYLESGQYKLIGRWNPGQRARSRLLKGFKVSVSAVLESPSWC